MNLKGRDFLTLKDYTPEEIEYLIELAAKLKKMKKDGVVEQPLLGKNVALIFEKTSTRTRCSFEVAAHDLGMGVRQESELFERIRRVIRSYAHRHKISLRHYERLKFAVQLFNAQLFL